MKRAIVFLCAGLIFFSAEAQLKLDKKYPSLLWEITGNGMKKPSYLIGTMHVSSKLAFNLPDSFYIAIRNAQVVALESNPETWQEDMNKYDFGNSDYQGYASSFSGYMAMPNDFLNIKTLRFYKYDTKIERSLYSTSSAINSLLYRSYGNESSDFEEDTYLDMYIFQCGKKWGKKVTGVEDYGESMRLMAEAYRDASKDKNRKERSYGDVDEEYSSDKLQEAYRTGNLDLLDSINKFNSESAAFDEKFIYKRNDLQAKSIDSILKSGSSLFVGVGAAHLPGDRGVIEILRKKGYKLRPVKMGERASRTKDLVDNIRVPVVFKTETADDGLYKVDIPGKFYKFGEDASLDQRQYADMSNGSYYMVTRVLTNAWMWNHGADEVYKTIDSLLYENVPGKIISKTSIVKNGYKGFDITNKTRRGDMQRYNIFITPFEIIFFKISGTGDYIKKGVEADKFFGSIQLKEYKSNTESASTAWKKYSPPYGGFSIEMPHEPYIGNDGSWLFDASEKATATNYRVIRTDIHNYGFVEEDTFDLGLMDESFASSEFIDTQVKRQQITFKGYPALDCKYKDKKGGVYLVRYLIQGPHYYTLVAHGKQETPAMSGFINSFEIKPYVYNEGKQQKDTSLYYTVTTPVYPESKKIKLDIPRYNYAAGDDEDEDSEDDLLEDGVYRNKIISNDSTGEKIYLTFYRAPGYYYSKDSTSLDKENDQSFLGIDSNWIVKFKKKSVLANKMKVGELILSDTGSSRALWGKSFYKDGIGFYLITQTDTLTKPSPFVSQFFQSFIPADTLKGVNPFEKKSTLFFEDFMNKDSLRHKRAVKHISDIYLDSTDLPQLKKTIAWLNWEEKKYLSTKSSLINKLGDIKTSLSADYLKTLYYALDDTVELQYAALESLLQHKTQYAYNILRDIINTEPPVLVESSGGYDDYRYTSPLLSSAYSYDDGKFLDELSDSLKLTRTILPDLLPLLNLEDYKSTIMKLLGEMVDSNLVKPKDYEMYFSKFLIEAKQELKKQSIAEKKKAIEKAEENKETKKKAPLYYDKIEMDSGNDDLGLYATLLVPFWETNAAVQPLIQQMLKSNDKRLKFSTMMLMLKKNRPFPDTMLRYFGSLEEFRYELYSQLKIMNKLDKFPSLYNNHLDLGKSSLMDSKSYGKPDSVVYVDRLKTEYLGKKGYIYYYKYKAKKDDLTWKLATVGLVPEDPKQFEFTDSSFTNLPGFNSKLLSGYRFNKYSFTNFTEVKLKDDELVMTQLKVMLKKMIYSRRKSAKQFYEENYNKGAETDYID